MLWRDTPTNSASCCWVQPRPSRSSLTRLLTRGAMTSRLYTPSSRTSSLLVMLLRKSSGRDPDPLVEEVAHPLTARNASHRVRRALGLTHPDAEAEIAHDLECRLVPLVVAYVGAERRLPALPHEPA